MDRSKPLASKIVLITGATGGIGKSTCHSLADLGCRAIAIHYNANEDAAASLEKELEAKGVTARKFKADMRDYEQVECLLFKFASG